MSIQTDDSANKALKAFEYMQDFLHILVLFLIESLCFFPLINKIGFYLDDWATFWNLHFAQPDFLSLLKASFSDPRMVTRPVQCVYYAASYVFFGDNPYGYHLLRCVIEASGAAFLYFGLLSFTKSRLIACIASILFLLYPSHDASHYWIGAGLGAGFGVTLYLLSFWLATKNLDSHTNNSNNTKTSKYFYLASLFAFALCAYCYEAFLPLLILHFLAAIKFFSAQNKLVEAGKKALLWALPFIAVGVSEPLYQRILVPRISKVFLSPSHIEPGYFVSVFAQGFNLSLGPELISFVQDRVQDALSSDWSRTRLIYLLLILALSAVSIGFSCKEKRSLSKNNFYFFIASSFLVVLCSYLTFAVAEGYLPTFWSMISRINTGASIGAALLIATFIMAFSGLKTKLKVVLSLVLSLPLIVCFTLSDWGLSGHWMRSWQVQKRIQGLVAAQASKLKNGDSVLLINTPRYVMWAPVFDGVWDFQSMVKSTTNNNNLVAGVVSERLDLEPSGLKDYSAGFLCASYPFSSLTLLVPSTNEWIKVRNPAEFISVVEEKGMGFGLSKDALAKWKKQLAAQKSVPN